MDLDPACPILEGDCENFLNFSVNFTDLRSLVSEKERKVKNEFRDIISNVKGIDFATIKNIDKALKENNEPVEILKKIGNIQKSLDEIDFKTINETIKKYIKSEEVLPPQFAVELQI